MDIENQSIKLKKEKQIEKWESLPREIQNEILIIESENPFNFKLVLNKYGLEDVDNVFTGLNSVIHNELVTRYNAELRPGVLEFNKIRKEWLAYYGDGDTMYIPESLWETAEKLGKMENYPKVPFDNENTTITELELSENNSQPEKNTKISDGDQDKTFENNKTEENGNSRLSQARRKLARLENEFQEKSEATIANLKRTNGQPMNDKRDGIRFLKKHDAMEEAVFSKLHEVEEQRERVDKLEYQADLKGRGFNNQGGLIMSVENIPRIKEEIENSKNGNSIFSKATIRKYEKEVIELEALQVNSKNAQNNISDHARSLIENGEVTQWKKKPTFYFVNGLRKVALELTPEGIFQQATKYPPKTDEEKEMIANLLSEKEVSLEVSKESTDLQPTPEKAVEQNNLSKSNHVSVQSEQQKDKPSIQEIIKKKDFKGLSEHLENGINAYLNSDIFKKYLDYVSKFHKYSAKNVRLILAQKPDASQVASFSTWKKMERHVKKGEHAEVFIYAPYMVDKRDKEGKLVVNENGEIEKETRFKLAPVFDISQTDGKEPPKQIYNLSEDLEDSKKFVQTFNAIKELSPASVSIEPIDHTANGYYSPKENRIVVKQGMGEAMTLKTLIHETTHAMLHTNSDAIFGDENYRRQEFEAESIAYIVSNHLGIDSSDYTFGYLASWTDRGNDLEDLASSLDVITNQAKDLIEKIDRTLDKTFSLDAPKNKFEERLAVAKNERSAEARTPKTQVEVVDPKKESPTLTR